MADAPRLYLTTPPAVDLPAFDLAAFTPALEAALAAGDVACLHLAAGRAGWDERGLKSLAALAQARGAAVLIDPPADLREVARLGVDGVHAAGSNGLAEALQALQPDRIVGAGGLRSRDAAMAAGEAGVDYVMFGEPRADGSPPPPEQVIERCRWWAEVFTTPCVGHAASPEMVAALAATGVEFIALGAWAFGDSPAQTAALVGAAARAARG